MPTFIIEVQEVWSQKVKIEAKNEEEAFVKVYEGDGENFEDPELICILDPDEWILQDPSERPFSERN